MNKQTEKQIERQIDINAPVAKVWRALTDHREFGAWFGVEFTSAFVPGEPCRGKLTLQGLDHLNLEIVVKTITPETYFAYTWHPYAVDPDRDYSKETPTLVEFRLEATAEGTRLTVIESGFDKLPASRRDEAFRMNEGGWTMQVERVADYVTGKNEGS